MSAPTILPLICTQVLPRSPCLSEHYPLATFICGAFFRILHNIKSCRLSVLCCQLRLTRPGRPAGRFRSGMQGLSPGRALDDSVLDIVS